MHRTGIVVFLLVILWGCGKGETRVAEVPKGPPAAEVETPKDPAEKLREQLRSAAVQLDPAGDKIQEALQAAKAIQNSPDAPKDLKQAMGDVADSLNSAGESIGDFASEPPELAEFKKDIPAHEKERKLAIDGCNDAIQDLKDAANTIDSIAESTPPKLQNPLEGVSGPIDEALSTVRDALAGLGGKEEQLDEDTTAAADDPGGK